LIFWYSCGYNGNMAGRPKKPDDEARGNVLRIRLTTDERKTLDDAAKSRGLESSTWARMELLTLAKKLLRAK
jgi:uncharacterized protein (DUF1778 family)